MYWCATQLMEHVTSLTALQHLAVEELFLAGCRPTPMVFGFVTDLRHFTSLPMGLPMTFSIPNGDRPKWAN